MEIVLNILIVLATIFCSFAIIATIVFIITLIRVNKTLENVTALTQNINELVNNPITVFSSMISKYL